MTSFLQHRRYSAQGYLRQLWGKMSRIGLCSNCRRISDKLEQIIDRVLKDPGGKDSRMGQRVTDRGDLEYVNNLNRRMRCSLCTFLSHMMKTDKCSEVVCLYIGLAQEQYGIHREVSEISDSFCLWLSWKQNGSVFRGPPLLPYNDTDDYRGPSGIALQVGNDPKHISGNFVKP